MHNYNHHHTQRTTLSIWVFRFTIKLSVGYECNDAQIASSLSVLGHSCNLLNVDSFTYFIYTNFAEKINQVKMNISTILAPPSGVVGLRKQPCRFCLSEVLFYFNVVEEDLTNFLILTGIEVSRFQLSFYYYNETFLNFISARSHKLIFKYDLSYLQAENVWVRYFSWRASWHESETRPACRYGSRFCA